MGSLVPVNDWSIRGAIEGDEAREGARQLAEQPSDVGSFLKEAPETEAPAPASAPGKDWTGAVLLVQEAAEAIRLGKERAAELEEEAIQQAKQHHADLKALHAELTNAREEIEAANARTRAAEQALWEANEWLEKLDGAIFSSFANVRRAS
jgi:hypothetical protein